MQKRLSRLQGGFQCVPWTEAVASLMPQSTVDLILSLTLFLPVHKLSASIWTNLTHFQVGPVAAKMMKFRFRVDKIRRRLLRGMLLRGHLATFNGPYPDKHVGADTDRFRPCYILWKHGDPVVIWLEDLLDLHGSGIQTGDLNLLVRDPKEAASILQSTGYEKTAMQTKFGNEPEFTLRGIRMTRDSDESGVVLLPAEDWYYDLDQDVDDFLPPLSAFLDSMLEFWLNISSQDYVDRLHFALCIGNLINDCYDLSDTDGQPLRDPAYAKHLQPQHREIHYDITYDDPKAESFTTTKRHEYHVRRSKEIGSGLFLPQPYKKGVFRSDLAILCE